MNWFGTSHKAGQQPPVSNAGCSCEPEAFHCFVTKQKKKKICITSTATASTDLSFPPQIPSHVQNTES